MKLTWVQVCEKLLQRVQPVLADGRAVTEPRFFSKKWADAVHDALVAGPSKQARDNKLQMYWDFFDRIKDMYPASWALGCRNLPAELGEGPAYLFVQWDGGTITGCQIIGPDDPLEATFVVLYPHGIDGSRGSSPS